MRWSVLSDHIPRLSPPLRCMLLLLQLQQCCPNWPEQAGERQIAHVLVKLLAAFLQVWLSPWQVAHMLSIASFVNSTLQSVMGPESPTRQQAPTQVPSGPAANSAIKMQLRLRLSFELALLSVLCSVSLAQHQVNLSTGCRHCATSTGGVQALLVLRSSPELALLSRMSSYWTYTSTLCTFSKHRMLLALLYMMSMY